jgi:hypothetical protein
MYYWTVEDNSAAVWDDRSGRCVGSVARYAPQGQPHPDCEGDVERAVNALNRLLPTVDAGVHDSTRGVRPTLFLDRDGDIALSYPAGPGWISWEQKVE